MAGRGKLIEAFLKSSSSRDASNEESSSSSARTSVVDLLGIPELLTEAPKPKRPSAGRGRLVETLINEAISPGRLPHGSPIPPSLQFEDVDDSDAEIREATPLTSQPTPSGSQPAIGIQDDPILKNLLSSIEVPPVVDPEPPKEVEPVDVITNFVRLHRDPNYDVYLYQLSFEPEVGDRKIIRKILDSEHVQRRLKTSPFMVGHKFYLPTKIDDFSMFPIPHPEMPGHHIQMTVTYIKQVPLREQLVIFNSLFKRIMAMLNYTFMKTKYFDEEQAINLEEWMMEIWPGYAVDVSLTASGELMLCCDISHRVLHKTNVYDQLKLLMPNERFKQVACRHLIGCSVITKYNKQTYRVDDIDFDITPQSTFLWGNIVITYADYFKTHWKVQIKHLNQPLLLHRKYSTRTSTYRIIYLVPELCNTTGLNTIQDRNVFLKIISHVQPPPNVRYQKLLKFIQQVHSHQGATGLLRDWGLTLEKASHTAVADKYPEEMIISNRENLSNFTNHRFLQTKNLPQNWSHLLRHSLLAPVDIGSKWMVIFQQRDRYLVDNFIRLCRRYAKTMSIELKSPRCISLLGSNTDDYIRAIKNNFDSGDKILVIVVPGNVEIKQRYDQIKQFCTIHLGIATQFIRASTLGQPRKMETICPNILVQMNCKIGGAPWGIQMPLDKVMYVGIDIYHRKNLRRKSVIGFVASLNSNATRWFSKAFVKEEDTSDICDESLMEAMTEALYKYRVFNDFLPSYIIIYRDDVGIPLEKLCKIEYSMLVNAIRDVYTLDEVVVKGEQNENLTLDDNGNLMPYIVFMTVAKRISVKLFVDEKEDEILDPRTLLPTEQQPVSEEPEPETEKPLIDLGDQEEKKSRVTNPPSGTILTMNAERFDQFYLVSQKTNNTCACPIRVRVLRNSGSIRNGTIRAAEAEENQPEVVDRLTSQFLQSVSYKLCYLYYNTASICRQPAPGMYAHKVANFVGEHLENVAAEDLEDKLFYL